MKGLLEDIQADASLLPSFSEHLAEGSEKTFIGLLVGVILGMAFWAGSVLIWLLLQ